MLLSESEEALSRCEESNSENRAVHAVSVSVLEDQLLLVKMDCESKEAIVGDLRSSLLVHEKAEQTLKSQLSNLMLQLEEALRREQVQIEAKNIAEELLKTQNRRKPWFLFFWPF